MKTFDVPVHYPQPPDHGYQRTNAGKKINLKKDFSPTVLNIGDTGNPTGEAFWLLLGVENAIEDRL